MTLRRGLTRHFLLLFMTLASHFLTRTTCELRFCHRGPQRIQLKECPYGVFFKKPITSKCIYYSKDETSSKAPTYSLDACPNAVRNPIFPDEKLEPVVFQSLMYNGEGIPDNSLDLMNEGSCMEECFSDVDMSSISVSDFQMPEYNYLAVSCTPEIEENQKNISQKLFDFLLFGQETEARIPSNRLHQLLELCSLILMRHCGNEYINPYFLSQAHESLKFLHYKINYYKTKEIPSTPFTVIKDRLQKCLQQSTMTMIVTGDVCASNARISKIQVLYPNLTDTLRFKYRVEPKSYRFGKLDLFIEAMWAVLDFARSFCYDEFRDSPLHFDMLVDQIGRVFSIPEVEKRWTCPPALQNNRFWNNLAGVGDVNWTMRNLDFCAQAAAKASVFKYRLDRTFEIDPDTPDSVLLKGPESLTGWSGGSTDYWQAYTSAGGIRGILKHTEEGICPASQQVLDIFRQEYLNC